MRARLLYIVLILTLPAMAVGQQVRFRALTQAKQILENGVFELEFRLENAKADNIEYPDLSDFTIISGPSVGRSMQIINGRRSSSVSWTFTLMGGKAGRYTIGSARVIADNRTYKTDPINIEVVEGKGGSTAAGNVMPTDEQIFLRAVIDTGGNVFPGQQIRVTYKLYHSVDIRNYNTVRESDYSDFYYRYVVDFDKRVYTEVIDGVQYAVRNLRSVALFPQKSGSYALDPLIINVGIGVQSERRSFFFNTRTIPKTITSNPIKFDVTPLPEPVPDDFTGAVGQYTMNVMAAPKKLTTDDALVVTAHFVGDGDAKRWSIPSIEHVEDRFDLYEPKINRDQSLDEHGMIVNRRSVEYILIPKAPGREEFRLNFVYLDPDSARYVTISSQPLRVQITQGTGVKDIDTDISLEAMGRELHSLASPKRAPRHTPLFIFRPLFYILCLMPFAFVGWVYMDQKKKDDYAGLDPAERKRREARAKAMKHLENAKNVIEAGDKLYYSAISDGLFAYISGKLQIPASELSKQNIDTKMTSIGIPEDLRKRVQEMIMRCEMVLYAGSTGMGQREQAYEDTVGLIVDIEDSLGDVTA